MWLPFVVAFAVALITAFSYLELVTKYPRAAGAALYAHKAFGIHFVTFIVAFAVMCSGITSASRAFAANLSNVFGLQLASGIGVTAIGLAFMALVAAINFRGVVVFTPETGPFGMRLFGHFEPRRRGRCHEAEAVFG